MSTRPDSVHFVGSIALNSVDEVFKTCGHALGRRLRRIPDGEPGGRRLWVSWQYPLLRASPYLQPAEGGIESGQQNLRLADGVEPEDIQFGELGYCREARISYQDFVSARERGDLPPDVRFQVSLPTPFAVIAAFVPPPDMQATLPAYEKAMIKEAQDICSAIPHHDLCIQWDVCVEMVAWDGQPSVIPPIPHKEQLLPGLVARMVDAVPSDVEVGIHLCYGDLDAKHFIEPIDAERMVSFANAIGTASHHPLAFVHLPVPIARDDDAFFEPFAELKLDSGTEVYLGLIHGDGEEAVQRRIDTASRHVPAFGVATECGIARQRTPQMVEALIEAHAAATRDPVR